MSNKFDLDKALEGAPIWVMSDKAWLFQSSWREHKDNVHTYYISRDELIKQGKEND